MSDATDTRDRVIRMGVELDGVRRDIESLRRSIDAQTAVIASLDQKMDLIQSERSAEKGQRSVWIWLGTVIIAAAGGIGALVAKFVLLVR